MTFTSKNNLLIFLKIEKKYTVLVYKAYLNINQQAQPACWTTVLNHIEILVKPVVIKKGVYTEN